MKTLKELNENCTLIAEFNNPAFMCRKSEQSYKYYGSPKCALYCNNRGKYYIYKYILYKEIEEYKNYEKAINRYVTLIKRLLEI